MPSLQHQILRYTKDQLLNGATIALRDCMGYKHEETVLILTDTIYKPMGDIFRNAAIGLGLREGKDLCYKVMTPTYQSGREPADEGIARLMKRFNIILIPTYYSLSHTKTRTEATEVGARIASMPNISPFSLAEGGMTADYSEVLRLTEKMYEAVVSAKEIRVTNPTGTDITMSFGQLKWQKDTGIFHDPHDFGNSPGGEADGCPNEGSANGRICPDHWAKPGTILEVKDGCVIKVEGAAEDFVKVLNSNPKNTKIAELGIGTNPRARDLESLEGEKIFGTVHIAFGNNKFYGGTNDPDYHKDVIMDKPTLIVDKKKVIIDGNWQI
jgi:leucyl aminopeptidase (aminopeptidase T)